MCAYYMMIGMTYEEFWHSALDDRWSIYDRRHMLEIENRNQELWLMGGYNLKALECVAGGLTGSKDIKYPEEPIRITPLTEDEKALAEEKNKAQLRAYFESLSRSINEKGKRKKEQAKADVTNES